MQRSELPAHSTKSQLSPEANSVKIPHPSRLECYHSMLDGLRFDCLAGATICANIVIID